MGTPQYSPMECNPGESHAERVTQRESRRESNSARFHATLLILFKLLLLRSGLIFNLHRDFDAKRVVGIKVNVPCASTITSDCSSQPQPDVAAFVGFARLGYLTPKGCAGITLKLQQVLDDFFLALHLSQSGSERIS